jgi:hypothetical protein
VPSFDGGRYFLTALIPIRTDAVEDPWNAECVTSHVHALREALVALPTALQSPATEHIGINSPFARDSRTHFARFAVIDNVAFNGRVQTDPIAAALRPPRATPQDELHTPYLIYVTDFDAPDGTDATRDAYFENLFRLMQPEWRNLLCHCHGYDRVDGPGGFARLIAACQVETTMPFNDYWEGAPPLTPLDLGAYRSAGIAALVALGIGLVVGLLFSSAWMWLALAGLLGVALAAFLAYRRIMAEGAKPFPMAPRSDLPGVLKALYLQQHFTRFAIAQQGASPEALHAAFGAFRATHKPDDVAGPTQPRGVIRS